MYVATITHIHLLVDIMRRRSGWQEDRDSLARGVEEELAIQRWVYSLNDDWASPERDEWKG